MDAHRYLAFAEALAKSAKDDPTQPNHDAICRSAISRAYYAVFLIAREFIDSLGIETRRIPNPHANIEQALRNSGVFTLQRLANALGSLCTDRTDADYALRNSDVETVTKVETVLATAKAAVMQFDIVHAGKLSPPLDRDATAEAILTWARANSKPLWRKT